MTDKEKALKVNMLQEMLAKDFGIRNHAELMEAIQKMEPVDISIFVLPPLGAVLGGE